MRKLVVNPKNHREELDAEGDIVFIVKGLSEVLLLKRKDDNYCQVPDIPSDFRPWNGGQ